MTCGPVHHLQRFKAAPAPLPGFENIRRYWDERRQRFIAKLSPGEYYVSRGQELISTVLGSCVAACVRDTRLCIGGMNHFLLPSNEGASDSGSCVNAGLRYGSVAMEHLINGLLAQGARRERLEVKVFGGATIIGSTMAIGQRNVEFVLEYLHTEGYPLASQSVGGRGGRKVFYDPSTGKALVKILRADEQDVIRRSERDYADSLSRKPVSGAVELF